MIIAYVLFTKAVDFLYMTEDLLILFAWKLAFYPGFFLQIRLQIFVNYYDLLTLRNMNNCSSLQVYACKWNITTSLTTISTETTILWSTVYNYMHYGNSFLQICFFTWWKKYIYLLHAKNILLWFGNFKWHIKIKV